MYTTRLTYTSLHVVTRRYTSLHVVYSPTPVRPSIRPSIHPSIRSDFNEEWANTDGWWGVTLWRVAPVAECVATIFLGIGGTAVLNGNMLVGTFVTSLGAISTFGGLTGSIFQVR